MYTRTEDHQLTPGHEQKPIQNLQRNYTWICKLVVHHQVLGIWCIGWCSQVREGFKKKKK